MATIAIFRCLTVAVGLAFLLQAGQAQTTGLAHSIVSYTKDRKINIGCDL